MIASTISSISPMTVKIAKETKRKLHCRVVFFSAGRCSIRNSFDSDSSSTKLAGISAAHNRKEDSKLTSVPCNKILPAKTGEKENAINYLDFWGEQQH